MGILEAFGILILVAVAIAFLSSSMEKAKESKLVHKGAIPPYTGYNEDEIRKLKVDGYETIAIKRIRRGYEKPKKCSLKKAVQVYDAL